MNAPRHRQLFGILGVLLALFLGQGLFFIVSNAQTFDEAVHLVAGYSYWAVRDFRLNAEDPPLIKQWCALPVYLWYRLPFEPDPERWQEAGAGQDRGQWWISRDFLYQSAVDADRMLLLARIPNLLLGGLLLGLIGWWAYRLWGEGAALLAIALAALEPTLLAHSCLVTTDLGASLFIFLTIYLLWEYTAAPSRGRLLAVGIAMGLALASKFSSILLFGMLPVLVGFHILEGGSFALPNAATGAVGLGDRLRAAIAPLLRIVCVALLVLLPVYFFQGYSTWAYGLRTQLNQQETSRASFLLGSYSADGWWYYFPVAFVLKTSAGTLLLIAASLVFFRAGKPLGRREALFLLGPVLLFLAVLTHTRLNIGIRHALPIYPFLIVLASRLATVTPERRWVLPLLLGIPLTWTAVSSWRIAPHQLAYFNELAGGPANGYRLLSDSNLDWGQDLRGVKEYMEREGLPMIYLSYFGTAPPGYYGIRYQYLPGLGELELPPLDPLPNAMKREILAISAVSLQGVYSADKDLYKWLWRRRPVATIGYSIYLYDLAGDADAHFQLARIYRTVGPRSLAEAELHKVLALDPLHTEAAALLRE